MPVELWRGKPGIDSLDVHTAHVCERHALFFVTVDGPMHGSEAGPFALPVDAQTRPARPFLPYGAIPIDDHAPWPVPKWAGADGRLRHDGGGDEPFVVRNTDRVLFTEPKAEANGMGITSHAIAGDAGLVAYARSNGPLVVAELGTGKRRARVAMRGDNVTAIAIHPAGSHVAFVVLEGGHQQHSLRVLEIGTGKVREFAREPASVPQFLQFTTGTPGLVGATWEGDVQGFALATGERAWQRTVDGGKAAFRVLSLSPDGRHLLLCSRGGLLAGLLDVRTGGLVGQFVVRQADTRAEGGGPAQVAWSHDSTKFVWTFDHGRLALGDVGKPGTVQRHFGAAELLGELAQLRFLPDGNSVQTRDRDGHQLRWPLASFDAPW